MVCRSRQASARGQEPRQKQAVISDWGRSKQNMRITLFCLMFFCLAVSSQAEPISGEDLRGTWSAEFTAAKNDSMSGKIEWISITFRDEGLVDWEWKRDGKTEKHNGKFSLKEIHRAGTRNGNRVELTPKTMVVYRSISLNNITIDHDNRFRLPEKVLKCQDHDGNDWVFSRQKKQQE